MTKTTKKRFFGNVKKRYLLVGLLLGFTLLIHSGVLSFRNTDEQLNSYLSKRGQTPSFHHYEYEGRPMHYVSIGAEAGKPLVLFLHGSPGAADAFIEYLADQRLSEKASLVAVDRPGFGYSGFGITESSLKRQADAIFPILQRVKPSFTILVGHSYGGPLAARIAMDHPEKVGGMVLVAPSIDPQLEPPTWWRSLLDIRVIRWLIPKALRVCNQEIIPLESELQEMLPAWKKIKAACIIIQGAKDKLVSPGNAAFGKKMLINSDTTEVKMVKDGNHFILWSETELITEAIIRLLERQKTTID